MWFHVSKKYLGESPILTPRLPKNGKLAILKYEGNIPRICVSNSIFFCLRAILGSEEIVSTDREFTENPCVYFTEKTPYLPPDYDDFRMNNEMWFIKKTQFFYLARIDMYRLFTEKVIVPTSEKNLVMPDKKIRVKQAQVNFITELLLRNKEDMP